MPRPLTISPAPFKSSYLAIPPTPFSPLLPVTSSTPPGTENNNAVSSAKRRAAQLKTTAELFPPPAYPLHWLWQCHKCNRVYRLGVTRRCLDDGHFFCAGSTVVKKSKRNGNTRKVVRHQACASEFDYQGWKGWGVWRRAVAEQVEAAETLMMSERMLSSGETTPEIAAPPARRRLGHKQPPPPLKKKECWNRCDYPSECRWGKQFGVDTPKVSAPSPTEKQQQQQHHPDNNNNISVVQATLSPAKTSFDEILGLLPVAPPETDPPPAPSPAPEPDYLEPLSPTRSSAQKELTDGETKIATMDDLLDSVKRRKRRSSGQLPSPLAAHPPSSERDGMAGSLVRMPSADVVSREKSPEELRPVEGEVAKKPRRAVDDLEVEFRRRWCQLPGLQEKADAFVKGLMVLKKGKGIFD